MKMSMKTIVLTSLLGFGLTVGFTQVFNKKNKEEEVVNKAAEYKAKSREKIKPHRYDGTKVTYFNYSSFEQKKVVEVLMYNGIDYKFCFNTDGVPKGIGLTIYDKDETSKERVKLFEAANLMGKDVVVTSEDMLKKLQAVKNVTSLKKVYIEYLVPIGDKKAEAPVEGESTASPQERGCVVVSFGYKNV